MDKEGGSYSAQAVQRFVIDVQPSRMDGLRKHLHNRFPW
jgi:hypothetical protein